MNIQENHSHDQREQHPDHQISQQTVAQKTAYPELIPPTEKLPDQRSQPVWETQAEKNRDIEAAAKSDVLKCPTIILSTNPTTTTPSCPNTIGTPILTVSE